MITIFGQKAKCNDYSAGSPSLEEQTDRDNKGVPRGNDAHGNWFDIEDGMPFAV